MLWIVIVLLFVERDINQIVLFSWNSWLRYALGIILVWSVQYFLNILLEKWLVVCFNDFIEILNLLRTVTLGYILPLHLFWCFSCWIGLSRFVSFLTRCLRWLLRNTLLSVSLLHLNWFDNFFGSVVWYNLLLNRWHTIIYVKPEFCCPLTNHLRWMALPRLSLVQWGLVNLNRILKILCDQLLDTRTSIILLNSLRSIVIIFWEAVKNY